jgi:hypothetical protein
MKSVATAPRAGAMASKNSIGREFFSELPEFNITVTVLSTSVKSWRMTSIAMMIPTWMSASKPNPIAKPSMKLCTKSSEVAKSPPKGCLTSLYSPSLKT